MKNPGADSDGKSVYPRDVATSRVRAAFRMDDGILRISSANFSRSRGTCPQYRDAARCGKLSDNELPGLTHHCPHDPEDQIVPNAPKRPVEKSEELLA